MGGGVLMANAIFGIRYQIEVYKFCVVYILPDNYLPSPFSRALGFYLGMVCHPY